MFTPVESKAYPSFFVIPGIDDLVVSRDRRVLLTGTGQPARQYTTLRGRTVQGDARPYLLHRLLCAAFHGAAPNDTSVVLYKNRDALDLDPDNLYWHSSEKTGPYDRTSMIPRKNTRGQTGHVYKTRPIAVIDHKRGAVTCALTISQAATVTTVGTDTVLASARLREKGFLIRGRFQTYFIDEGKPESVKIGPIRRNWVNTAVYIRPTGSTSDWIKYPNARAASGKYNLTHKPLLLTLSVCGQETAVHQGWDVRCAEMNPVQQAVKVRVTELETGAVTIYNSCYSAARDTASVYRGNVNGIKARLSKAKEPFNYSKFKYERIDPNERTENSDDRSSLALL